jgi:hypothetical protein
LAWIDLSVWGALARDGSQIDRQWEDRHVPFKEAFAEAAGGSLKAVSAALRRLSLSGVTSPHLLRVTNSLLADLSSGAHRRAGVGLRLLR